MPDLVARSCQFPFISDGLTSLFKEFSQLLLLKEKFELEFVSFEVGEPKIDEYGAKKTTTYDAR